MGEALKLAQIANGKDEVPIGAVVVLNGEIIGYGYNQRETNFDVTAHAEIIAIKAAATHLKTWKLTDCEIYVTVKPCLMCYSAIVQSRIKRIYFGADQYSFKKQAFDNYIEDNEIEVIGPILEDGCSKLMSDFFERMRNDN